MKSDIEIAREAKLKPINDIIEELGIKQEYLFPYGAYKGKISIKLLNELDQKPDAKLILITAITPTSLGEGKTTISIGLSMALNKLGKKSIVTLRQPSLGPVFGIKGGAAGGGYSQVLPMEDINLHFTGDIHAISSAHNLLSAVIDNHFHFGNKMCIDEQEILFKRTMDMNDRALRNIVVGLGGKLNGPAREDGFIITAASEVMAILSLSTSILELKERLSKILIAFDSEGKLITANDFGVCGAMTAILKDAINPNIVQTIEHTPAFIHVGPFANIAHGTNSIVATKMALKLSDYVITEAGFATDLGAEKFIDIVSRIANFKVNAAVIVTTVRALKLHGGAPEKNVNSGTAENIKNGLDNLKKHIENIQKFNIIPIVAINVFTTDKDYELQLIKDFCRSQNVKCTVVNAFEYGSEGAIELAETVIKATNNHDPNMNFIYDLDDLPEQKIEKIAYEIYGADRVMYTPKAEKDIERAIKLGFSKLPVCIAKTNRSLSDDPKLYGRPKNFKITITDVNISAGAGYLVPLAGEIMLMPGLAKYPNAFKIDIDDEGNIIGLS